MLRQVQNVLCFHNRNVLYLANFYNHTSTINKSQGILGLLISQVPCFVSTKYDRIDHQQTKIKNFNYPIGQSQRESDKPNAQLIEKQESPIKTTSLVPTLPKPYIKLTIKYCSTIRTPPSEWTKTVSKHITISISYDL